MSQWAPTSPLRSASPPTAQTRHPWLATVVARASVSSVALLPLPKVGISDAATFRLVHTEHVSWDLKADADADVVIIAPAPGLGVSTGVTVRFGGFESGVRVGVDADAVVAVVVNTAGAAAYVDVFAGARF